MKLIAVVLIAVSIFAASVAAAVYDSCTPCHNNRLAPDLRGRYASADELMRAARATKNPMMGSIKQNDKMLKEAAGDIGLK